MSRATNLASAWWLITVVIVEAKETPASKVLDPFRKQNSSGGIWGRIWRFIWVINNCTITHNRVGKTGVRVSSLLINRRQGAFDHVQWIGHLEYLWSIGCHGKVFHLFKSYLSDQYIRVVTLLDWSNHHFISTDVSQGTIWSLNFYVSLFPELLSTWLCRWSYPCDHHSLKENRTISAAHLTAELAALC